MSLFFIFELYCICFSVAKYFQILFRLQKSGRKRGIMKKEIAVVFALNSILNVTQSFNRISSRTSASILEIAYPYTENGGLSLACMLFNFTISLCAIVLLCSRIDKHLAMAAFEMRGGINKYFLFCEKDIIKCVFGMIFAKALSDIGLILLFEPDMIKYLVPIEIEFTGALFIWYNLFFLFRLAGISSNVSLILLLAVDLISLLFFNKAEQVSLFAYVTGSYSQSRLIIKAILAAAFLISAYFVVKEKDFLYEKGERT